MSDPLAPDDNSVTARLTRIEQRLTELEQTVGQPVARLALPAPEKSNGRAAKS